MLAGNNDFLQEAVESLYVENAEDIARQQRRAREDAEKRERTLIRDKRKLQEEKARLQEENARLQEENARLQEENVRL